MTGDQQLFGILGRGKEQVAYAKVDLNVVDVTSSEVVYSASGAGEYSLSNREVIGFGGSAGYDSTLNGKVLDLAIREAVDRLVDGITQAPGRPPPTKGESIMMKTMAQPRRTAFARTGRALAITALAGLLALARSSPRACTPGKAINPPCTPT